MKLYRHFRLKCFSINFHFEKQRFSQHKRRHFDVFILISNFLVSNSLV